LVVAPDGIQLKSVKAKGRAKNGQVSGVEVSFMYKLSGGSDRADTFLIGRLADSAGTPIKANPIFRAFQDDRGDLRCRDRLDSWSHGRWKQGSMFFPYFAMDLPPGEHMAKMTFEGQAELRREAPPEPVKLEGATSPEIGFTKPPAKMVRLGVKRVQVAEGRYDTLVFSRSRLRPELAWRVLFDMGRGHYGGTIHTSSNVQDSYQAAWDEVAPEFPLCQGDHFTISVLDIDVSQNDVISRFTFSLDDLQKAAASGQPLTSGKVLELELGSVSIR
jgi:hypothetical protein